jgi:uncharacterized heparinase superfamily protein
MTAGGRGSLGEARPATFRNMVFANPLYRVTLLGKPPKRLTRLPPPAWPGDPARGAAIAAGRIVCAGQALEADRPQWHSRALEPAITAELNSFTWLDDLAAQGDEPAKRRARDMIADWLERAPDWHPVAWAPHVLGMRVSAWLSQAAFLARGRNDELGPRILASLTRQVVHLGRTFAGGADGVPRLLAIKGLVFAGLCGIGSPRRATTALRRLRRELAVQILPDGGHISRAPSMHLRALAALVEIRGMLEAADRQVPVEVHAAIERMAPMVRYFRHGDGSLCLFNGGVEEESVFIDAVLERAGVSGEAPPSPPDMAFQRMAAGTTLVLMDAGPPPPKGYDSEAHAGALSIEVSSGQERVIVNCGAYPAADESWERAQRSTAAHSTITIDDTSSAEQLDDGGLGHGPQHVESTRDESDGNVWVSASHDGYRGNFDMTHRRRLFLSRGGDDVRGEDTLEGAHRGHFALRFHLHPEVQPEVIQNGAAVVLRVQSGKAWRLQASGGRIELAESVYLGRRGEMWRSSQVVVSGPLTGQGATLKWALKRFDRG